MSILSVYERDEILFQRFGVAVFVRPRATGTGPRPDLVPASCLQCGQSGTLARGCACGALYVTEATAEIMRTWKLSDIKREMLKEQLEMVKSPAGRAELLARQDRIVERLRDAAPSRP